MPADNREDLEAQIQFDVLTSDIFKFNINLYEISAMFFILEIQLSTWKQQP